MKKKNVDEVAANEISPAFYFFNFYFLIQSNCNYENSFLIEMIKHWIFMTIETV